MLVILGQNVGDLSTGSPQVIHRLPTALRGGRFAPAALGLDDFLARSMGGSAVEQRGLDQRHRDKNGEISKKHGNTLVRILRKVYGTTFAAGQAETAKLSDVLQYLNDTSLGQLVHDHKNLHLEKKIKRAEK
jgi:hypothetical protein